MSKLNPSITAATFIIIAFSSDLAVDTVEQKRYVEDDTAHDKSDTTAISEQNRC
jgi:hypothetical protein